MYTENSNKYTYINTHKNSVRNKLLDKDRKPTHKNQLYFFTPNTIYKETEIKRIIPFILVSKKNKMFRNLTLFRETKNDYKISIEQQKS